MLVLRIVEGLDECYDKTRIVAMIMDILPGIGMRGGYRAASNNSFATVSIKCSILSPPVEAAAVPLPPLPAASLRHRPGLQHVRYIENRGREDVAYYRIAAVARSHQNVVVIRLPNTRCVCNPKESGIPNDGRWHSLRASSFTNIYAAAEVVKLYGWW